MFEQLKIDDAVEQATKLAKDGVYLTVGLVSATAQKTQEQWQEAARQLEAGLASSKDQVATFTARFEPAVKAVDERFTAFEARLAELVERTAEVLPEPAGKAIEAAFEAGKTARAQVFQLVLPEAPKAKARGAKAA
jgi:ABC-type transporter Mla subunit MlaD